MIPTTGHCLWEPPLTYNSYRVPLVCTIGPPLIPSAQREAALNPTPMQPTGGDLRSARQKPNEIASEYRGPKPNPNATYRRRLTLSQTKAERNRQRI